MTGKIQFKMRSEPTPLWVASVTGAPVHSSGSGSFDREALAALEAALGTLDGALPTAPQQASICELKPEMAELLDDLEASLTLAPAPVPVVTATTTRSGLRTARELLAAMDMNPDDRPAPRLALDWTQAPADSEPSPLPRGEGVPTRTEPRELRNGDLPPRPAVPVKPDRPRRAPAPQLEPPDFDLSSAKRRRFLWPFR